MDRVRTRVLYKDLIKSKGCPDTRTPGTYAYIYTYTARAALSPPPTSPASMQRAVRMSA